MKAARLSFAIILIFFGCDKVDNHQFPTGHFTEEVVNFAEVNSEYDDYNSTSPVIEDQRLLYFSSNRDSHGGTFNIVGENLTIQWSKSEGRLNIGTNVLYSVATMLGKINTAGNEFGPHAVSFNKILGNDSELTTELLLYSTDEGGNADIQFVYSDITTNKANIVSKTVSDPLPISFASSDANELYPSFYGENYYGIYGGNIDAMVYCSDADGDYDIFMTDLASAQMSTAEEVISTLTAEVVRPKTKLSINSSQDDKCPFIVGNLLVFASNRPGGFGGYDLYYSLNENGHWSEPMNFGDKINSSADEFRPIVIHNLEFDNHLMIFSSNRAGGMGGFDLYYSGIPELVRNPFIGD